MTSTATSVHRTEPVGLPRWVVIASCVAASAVLAVLELVVHHGWADWAEDMAVYRAGGGAVRHGSLVYATSPGALPFTYPPFAALVFVLPALLPTTAAMVAGNAVEAGCLIAVVWCCLRRCGVADQRVLLGGSIALAVLALPLDPVDADLLLGQVNVLLMALVLADLLRPDTARTKGMGIGLAAGLKLTPLIFVAYLACTGRIRQALLALGAFAATIAVGFAVLPTDSANYWGGGVFDVNRVGKPQSVYDQALRSVLSRLLGTTHVGGVWFVVAGVVGVLGLGTAVLVHRRGAPLTGVCVCALTGLLVSPISWEHHWVWVVPALVVAGGLAVRTRSAPAWAGIVVVYGVFAAKLFWWGVPHQAAKELHMGVVGQLYAASFAIAGAGLLVWLVVSSRSHRAVLP